MMKRRSPLTLSADVTIGEALRLVREQGHSGAVVVDGRQVLGHISLEPERGSALVAPGLPTPPKITPEERLAREIQLRLLPRSVPEIPGLEVHGELVSAREVGGDYWSAKYYRSDRRATLKLADVTGHGITAALLVPAVKFVSGGFYRGAPSPEWVMERTNHVLVKETPVELMVSMVYAWYTIPDRKLLVVNAGHSPVFVVRKGVLEEIAPGGPMLGLMETSFSSTEISLEPGDLFFVCSDGITEARASGERFGEGRVRQIVVERAQQSPKEIVHALLEECFTYAGPPEDDRSVLAARAVEDTTQRGKTRKIAAPEKDRNSPC